MDLHEGADRPGEHLPVVFLSAYSDIPTTVKAIKRGAIDFLTKPVDRVTLLAAIESALAHDRQERGRLHEVQVLAERFTALSPRERDVLGLVVAGRLNKQIADDLHMAERTVKAHRAHAMAKLNARTLAELVTIVRSIEQHAGSVRNVRP